MGKTIFRADDWVRSPELKQFGATVGQVYQVLPKGVKGIHSLGPILIVRPWIDLGANSGFGLQHAITAKNCRKSRKPKSYQPDVQKKGKKSPSRMRFAVGDWIKSPELYNRCKAARVLRILDGGKQLRVARWLELSCPRRVLAGWGSHQSVKTATCLKIPKPESFGGS